MTATVSPVRLVSPASMRFGVWRSLSARIGDERTSLSAAQVRVNRSRGGSTQSHDFHPIWVRVEPSLHDRALIRLSGEGQRVVVGEFVPANGRWQLAEELRWALRHLDD